MRKYEAAGSSTWSELEKADSARIVNALLDMHEFMVQMKSRTRYSPIDTPIKRLCCPRGHEIVRLQAEVDIPMLSTGNHDEDAIRLREAGEESDNYKPSESCRSKNTDRIGGSIGASNPGGIASSGRTITVVGHATSRPSSGSTTAPSTSQSESRESG